MAIADGLTSMGWFRLRQGRIDEARGHFVASATGHGEAGGPLPPGDGTDPLGGLGVLALVEGDYREAVRLGLAVIARAESEGHPGNLVNGLYLLVRAALLQGQHRVAQRHARRMQAALQALDNRWFAAYAEIELGNIAAGLGAYAAARAHYEAAYALREEYGDPEGMALALAAQGRAALLAGAPAEAARLHERSLAIYEYLGDQGGLAGALDGLGRALAARGAHGQARDAIGRALRIAAERGFTPLQLGALTSAAELLAAAGMGERGWPLLRLVARHPAADGETARRAQGLLLAGGAGHAAPDLAPVGQDALALTVADALRLLAEIPADAVPPASGEASVAEPLHEPLSARERAILAHLAAGRSNQEIADLLICAVGTVKWYTAQIYGKLAVRSRTQAIARARELGLLP
jgi:ATP/maltotriose-dependent transcriptional regulator MalT